MRIAGKARESTVSTKRGSPLSLLKLVSRGSHRRSVDPVSAKVMVLLTFGVCLGEKIEEKPDSDDSRFKQVGNLRSITVRRVLLWGLHGVTCSASDVHLSSNL